MIPAGAGRAGHGRAEPWASPGTKEVLSLEDLEAAAASTPAASTSCRSWSRTSPACWRASPGCSRGAASTSTRWRSGPTDDPTISRITLTVDGALHPIDQVTKQLHKLVNVIKIRDLEPEETVARELALFKVSAGRRDARARSCSSRTSSAARVVDVSKRSVTIEVTGTDDKIEAFEEMVRPFGLIEMVRTGEIAVSRGRTRQT